MRQRLEDHLRRHEASYFELLRRMVAEGKLGQKSGRGFYEWND